MNAINLAEEELKKFLPTLKSLYPEGRKNNFILRDIAALYERIMLPDDISIALFDHRTASYFHLGGGVEKLLGYQPKTLLKWGAVLAFKAVHYSHYSLMYNEYRLRKKITHQLPSINTSQIQSYCCGLKLVDKAGQLKRAFSKIQPLVFDNKNDLDISIEFWEDITPFIKGDGYWLRFNYENQDLVYIHSEGKKEFNHLLSKRQLDILELFEKNKSTAEISELLGLSKMTVETHRKNMLNRTGAVNLAALSKICKMADIL